MKIISKYKDYYCYLQGQYGIDEKVVFVRDSIFKDYSYNGFDDSGQLYYFHILGKTYCGLYTKDGWIHDFDELDKYYKDNSSNRFFYSSSRKLALYLYGEISWWKKNKLLKIYPETSLNIQNNCPILVTTYNDDPGKFPLLKSTFIPSILPAHDIYVGLVDWFSYKEPVVETKPEDMLRFESKGFDKKDSFRNVK